MIPISTGSCKNKSVRTTMRPGGGLVVVEEEEEEREEEMVVVVVDSIGLLEPFG